MQKTAAPISFRSVNSLLLVFGLLLTGCVAAPPPYQEYTLARAAIRAAQDVDSARFSGGYWNRAFDSFRSGEKAFKNADYAEAKDFFVSARVLAEKAENATRLKRFQTGDGQP
jgi:hypothetical protein